MTPEERELLNQSVVLAKENNKMLRSMVRSARIASLLRVIYWVFIIGSLVGAYYVVQPYLNQILDAYSGAESVLKTFQ